jgi:hypothetical protein
MFYFFTCRLGLPRLRRERKKKEGKEGKKNNVPFGYRLVDGPWIGDVS